MNSFNRVILAGNLTRNPELRYTAKGTPTTTLGMALNRKWKDDSGAEKEETTFIDVEVWGAQAEAAAKYLAKGSRLLVEGRLKLNMWDDKQTNQKRSQIVAVLESMTFLDAPKNTSQGHSRANAAQGARP